MSALPTTTSRRPRAKRVGNEARCHPLLCPFVFPPAFEALAEDRDRFCTFISLNPVDLAHLHLGVFPRGRAFLGPRSLCVPWSRRFCWDLCFPHRATCVPGTFVPAFGELFIVLPPGLRPVCPLVHCGFFAACVCCCAVYEPVYNPCLCRPWCIAAVVFLGCFWVAAVVSRCVVGGVSNVVQLFDSAVFQGCLGPSIAAVFSSRLLSA